MIPQVVRALERGEFVDITTTGRRSGRPHRVEVALFEVRGRIYLTGFPGPRDWYANLLAEPRFVVHLKGDPASDLPALARPVGDPGERATVFGDLAPRLRQRPEVMVAASPLVEVSFPGS
jgi:deazaflavin-dependent oxidoreductase (nitroreductase family)